MLSSIPVPSFTTMPASLLERLGVSPYQPGAVRLADGQRG